MNRLILLVLPALVLISLAPESNSHSLPISAEMKKKIIEANLGKDLPVVWSYHIHCMFVLGEKETVETALNLRQSFVDKFNLTGVPLCKSTFDDLRLCMFDVDMQPDVDSPFLSGNWAVMVPIEWFSSTVQWIMQNRGTLDILVHPNTGAEVSDHFSWLLKGGNPWPLNKAAFGNQTFFSK